MLPPHQLAYHSPKFAKPQRSWAALALAVIQIPWTLGAGFLFLFTSTWNPKSILIDGTFNLFACAPAITSVIASIYSFRRRREARRITAELSMAVIAMAISIGVMCVVARSFYHDVRISPVPFWDGQ